MDENTVHSYQRKLNMKHDGEKGVSFLRFIKGILSCPMRLVPYQNSKELVTSKSFFLSLYSD